MTLPDERYQAIVSTRQFLLDIISSKKIKRLPLAVRHTARCLLTHYPNEYDLKLLSEKSPNILIPEIEPVTRLLMQNEQRHKGIYH